MTSIITAREFSEITGVTGDEVGEEQNSGRLRDNAIGKAQIEFFRDVGRTFTSTDTDYTLAQEAVSYLAAHKLATQKMGLVSEQTRVSPYYNEYKRLLGLITKGTSTDTQNMFQGGVDSVTSQEDSADYVEDMVSE